MQAHGKGLEFAYTINSGVPSLIQGDPVRIRQIILNLTNNAIKFTQHGEIILRVSLLSETDRDVKLKFEVTDTGIGIPEDKLDHVFKEFQQSDTSTTRMYGGTGLGLSISKKLAEMMNGEIGVTSTDGKGSTFWFTALFNKQPRSEMALTTLPESVADKRFLLVDDNKTNLEILSGYLSAWGCSFDMALSGEMALTLMNAVGKVNAPFDVVIIDMLMPGMDGAELGQRIKNDPDFKDTKLVMLTSMGLRGDATRMKEIGFSVYLTKPIRRSQLFNSLIALFSQGQPIEGYKKAALITRHTLSEQERTNINILLAEDNVVNQKLVLLMIQKFGFKADAVSTGKEVLERLSSFDYNLVLMDVNMPEMDGIEATRHIRGRETRVRNHELPIIALTANAMKGDKEICFEAGMNDYVTKPIDPQELLDAIERNIKTV
jgi:CheY-like chemotaxis protein